MIWDEEVDVVCTGSGVAGLARAISAVDVGGDVFVADSSGDRGPAESTASTLGSTSGTRRPADYFAALSSDLGPLRRHQLDVEFRSG